jgi:hypothetical protein
MGQYFMERLGALKAKHAIIADVRGRGLMIGVELSSDGDGSAYRALETALVCERNGLHITFSYLEPVLRIIPPLVISTAEIDQAISIMDRALTTVERGDTRLMEIIPQNCRSGDFVKAMIKPSPVAMLKKMWDTSPRQWVDKIRSMRGRE